MKAIQGLIEEASRHENIAQKLREAAALIGIPAEKKRHTHRRSMDELVKLLKKEKTMRVSKIVEKMGVAKPTIYSWLRKNEIFTNNEGEVSLKDAPK